MQNFWEVIVTKGTLKPQRFITAVDMKHPEFTEQLSRELWKRIYEEVCVFILLLPPPPTSSDPHPAQPPEVNCFQNGMPIDL